MFKRNLKSLNTLSIKDALSDNGGESENSEKNQHPIFANNEEAEEFTPIDLEEKWKLYLSKLDDRPSLQSTLLYVPEIKEGFELHLEIENTVQEDSVNTIKPELISWLRKELHNSKISLVTKITKKERSQIYYTDEEKYEEMLKKNPNLADLKQKFNLDFGD